MTLVHSITDRRACLSRWTQPRAAFGGRGDKAKAPAVDRGLETRLVRPYALRATAGIFIAWVVPACKPSPNERANMPNFKNSNEAALRRFVRSAIKHSDLSRANKDVTTAIVNLWFHHRNGPEGVIHPGRDKLAKSAKCTVKSVSRCLSMLKVAGVVVAVKYENGGQLSTRYRVRIGALLALCGCDIPGEIGGQLYAIPSKNVPVEKSKMSRFTRDKMSHGIYNVGHVPFQEGEIDLIGDRHE